MIEVESIMSWIANLKAKYIGDGITESKRVSDLYAAFEWQNKRIIELEVALIKESKRIDWISRQSLEDLSMGIVIDADHDGEYFVIGDSPVSYGKTLREAIDNAIKRERK